MKKITSLFFTITILTIIWGCYNGVTDTTITEAAKSQTKILTIPDTASEKAKLFYKNARAQIGVVKTYDFSNGYYTNGGYPPADTGVCTDVISRAFDITMSGSIRKLVDKDIRANSRVYNTKFDTNINFRRVRNLDIFFSRKGKILTKELIAWDIKNLSEWQTGDIVTFEKLPGKWLWHIGIISDKRNSLGVPFMIDNHGYGTNIRITPLDWPASIMGHYRYF